MTHTINDPASVGMSAERLARVNLAMQKYVEERGFGGISTMLARRGKIVHFGQVGYQDREIGTPMAPDTTFRIYSMTKPVICTALMMLHEEGRFQLFDPLAKFLPAFGKLRVLTADEAGTREETLERPITIQHLFTHTAGLTYNFQEDSPVCRMYHESGVLRNSSKTLEAIVAELARFPLAYVPGTRWHYSMSIDVLGHLIEVISGQPLEDFLRERLFNPLGMKDTAFSVPLDQHHRLSTMYGYPDIVTHTFSEIMSAWEAGQSERRDVEPTYPSHGAPNFARGGFGLFSTCTDYMRFAHMLLGGGQYEGVRMLGRKTLDLMHSNHLAAALLPIGLGPVPFPGYGFGLGSRVLLNVAESAVPGSVGEFGWVGAAKTYFWVDPQEEMIGLLMTQCMACFELPDKEFQVLAYAALVD